MSGNSGISGISGTGTSGISGLQATSGISGISGLSGRSGISGLSGTGPSGISGISGTGGSGISGLQSTSGISGLQSTSGISGISGAGGGTSGISGLSGQAGSGTGGADYVLVASSSCYVLGDGNINNFIVGVQNYGWADTHWDNTGGGRVVLYDSTSESLECTFVNVLIPIPKTITNTGHTISLCGTVRTAQVDDIFDVYLGRTDCPTMSGTPISITGISSSFGNIVDSDCNVACFNVDGTANMTECDGYFIVGFNVRDNTGTAASNGQFSFSLHIVPK